MSLRIESGDFPKDKETELIDDLNHFTFPLDSFQKWAIDAIKQHHNVLVTAGTGAGKTVVADYAIFRCIQQGLKAIYTSPIKSLSNQKYKEFTDIYTGVSIGIITGDIKFNPNAQILIMTTEILRNLLYYGEVLLDHESGLSLRVDIATEVGAVIFDEVHYISDPERGKVWEECFILLPQHIDLVLLSATISHADEFANWLVTIKNKSMCLVERKERVIPLKYFLFWSVQSSVQFKKLSVTEQDALLQDSGQLVLFGHEGHLTDSQKSFIIEPYEKAYRLQRKLDKFMDHREILNQLVNYLRDHQMTPAVFFTFSRRKCQEYARLINRSLNDSQVQQEVDQVIERQLRKLENYQYYVQLTEFRELRALLMKGIAYHHSGLIPVFKEIIEILFAQGLVSILIATETFAVGVNMPVKTVVFTGLSKIDTGPDSAQNGSGHNAPKRPDFRWLKSSEFRQQSGRAGRRGKDPVGNVILLPNLYDLPTPSQMIQIKEGAPDPIVSHFSLNYQLILRILMQGGTQIRDRLLGIVRGSLWQRELQSELEHLKTRYKLLSEMTFESEYTAYHKLKNVTVNGFAIKMSQRETKQRQKEMLEYEKRPGFVTGYQAFLSNELKLQEEFSQLPTQIDKAEHHIENKLDRVLDFLRSENCLVENELECTMKGTLASRVSHCQELLLVEMLMRGVFTDLEPRGVVSILSVFTDVSLDIEINSISALNDLVPKDIRKRLQTCFQIADELDRREETFGLTDLGSNWNLSLNLVAASFAWAGGESNWSQVLALAPTFSGNLVKEFLKINHLSQELLNLAEMLNDQALVVSCEKIPALLLRELVTVDSLYVKG